MLMEIVKLLGNVPRRTSACLVIIKDWRDCGHDAVWTLYKSEEEKFLILMLIVSKGLRQTLHS